MGSGRNKRSGQVRTTSSSGVARTYIIVGAVIAAFVADFIALVVIDSRQQAASSPPGEVETYDVGSAGQHTQSDVDYEQAPPAGGEHNPVWQNEGYYEAPVRDVNAVHTLEHGGVWITYSPDLPQTQKDETRQLVEGQTCMLASPHPDLPAPVAASAWGKQLTLEGAGSPDLERSSCGPTARARRPRSPGPPAPAARAIRSNGVVEPGTRHDTRERPRAVCIAYGPRATMRA